LLIEKTTPYYRIIKKLKFPSIGLIILALFLINLGGSSFTFFLSEGNFGSLLRGIYFGIMALSFTSLISDIISSQLFLRNDSLFSLRRCIALSLFTCTIWIFILFFGFILNYLIPFFTIPENAFYLGLFIILPFRFTSILTMSESNLLGRILFSILQPLLCILTSSLFFNIPLNYTLLLFILSATISFVLAYFIIYYIESQGLKKIGASPTEGFRAFLVAWLDRKNAKLEKFLSRLGVERSISVTVLQFRSRLTRKLKGIMVVSNFHPGPFMNVGSSILPYMIQNSFEEKTKAKVAVPHGISGHERNLVSQKQNQKVIRAIERLLLNDNFSNGASPLISNISKKGSTQANCQILDNCALITLSQSPEDMEDIPLEIGKIIFNEARNYFNLAAVIDAHNSIERIRHYSDQELSNFKESAFNVIHEAAKTKIRKFRFGSAKKIIKDFTLQDGFGPGGISIFLVEVNDKLTAYITIDGNNMVPGLREKILKAINEIGVENGEVMTTDTHMVNGLVSAKLGYHPVGEVINEAILIKKIQDGTIEAKRDLEKAEIAVGSEEINVKSLGSEMFNKLLRFMYDTAKKISAYLLVSIFGLSTIGIMLLK